MGRWSWQCFRGQNGTTICLVTCYRPVPPGPGSSSVYAQHLTYFSDTGRSACPRQAFLDDLRSEICKWKEEGDQVLVMGDINDPINSHKIRAFFAKLGMRELITEKHGTSGPATTRSNKSDEAIDGIWGTLGISIIAGGYLPFHFGPKSDHRMLWIKLTHQVAFGGSQPPFRAPSARKLHLRHPRGQKRYITYLKQFLRKHKVLERFRALASRRSCPPAPDTTREYEALDRTLMNGRRAANARTRCLHMSGVQSSRAIKLAQLRLRLAILLINRLEDESKVKLKTVTKLAARVGRRWWLPLGSTELLRQKCMARRDYFKLKRNHVQLWSTYMEERARELEAAGKGEEARILHTQIRTEKERERNQRLKRLRPRQRGVGVNKLVVKDTHLSPSQQIRVRTGRSEPITREVTDRAELEQLSMTEIGGRSRMSERTPGMIPPLVNLLHYDGITEFGDELLRGRAPTVEGIDDHTQAYLDQLKSVSGLLPEPASPVPFPHYVTAVNRLREGTSSGPSDTTPAMVRTELDDMELAEIGWHRFNFPWCTGYSPDRFRRGLDLLLHKDPNDFRPHRLRPILLFDIEANLHNKVLGRYTMRNAEAINGLAPEQYGSRSFKAADIQALNTRLFYDLVRLKRIPATSTFVDLVSSVQLRSCCPQPGIPLTAKSECPQGAHHVHSHHPPRYGACRSHLLWRLGSNLRRGPLGGPSRTTPPGPWSGQRSCSCYLGRGEHANSQLPP